MYSIARVEQHWAVKEKCPTRGQIMWYVI